MITYPTSELSDVFGATSILNCAPKIFSCAPRILAVHLEVYTW